MEKNKSRKKKLANFSAALAYSTNVRRHIKKLRQGRTSQSKASHFGQQQAASAARQHLTYRGSSAYFPMHQYAEAVSLLKNKYTSCKTSAQCLLTAAGM